ncbi:pyridoxal phosphate-dependent decarboxylase family protein [Streptomyces sp. NPDC004250]|uniref:pyridoxal phosphate-dependent decarboxylase family protein n=1 Tax=Streptomyces sp. NPDC004250 TaxID=3364692 RepID=UPI00368C6A44
MSKRADAGRMHRFESAERDCAGQFHEYLLRRIEQTYPPLQGPRTAKQLEDAAGPLITAEGLGYEAAYKIFTEVIAPATIAMDHPRMLAYIPAAPTVASELMDSVIAASSIYAGSWLEASGAVYAESAALEWLTSLAGLPASAGGTFVAGATIGTLSALTAARESYLSRREYRPRRWRIAATREAHSSVAEAAHVLDAELLALPVSDDLRVDVNGLAEMHAEELDGVFAVVGTAGTTNIGVVDNLAALAEFAERHDLWFHVDGAYGGAALAAPSVRAHFDGIERCDSLVIDPHKWLFGPFDCCALLYRDPGHAIRAHRQDADYLETLNGRREFNPADLAIHLTRRARGLPFWFSLAVHGTGAYAEAVEAALNLTREVTRVMDDDPLLEVAHRPELSVIVFRRIGWGREDYLAWENRLLQQGIAFVAATRYRNETLARLCFVNPLTTMGDVKLILDGLRDVR